MWEWLNEGTHFLPHLHMCVYNYNKGGVILYAEEILA